MFNTFQFNTGNFGTNGVLSVPSTLASAIEFNGYSLQSASIVTQTLRHDSMPRRDLSIARNVRNHGGLILNDTEEVKLITISGILTASTAALLETLIDEVKMTLIPKEGNLDVMNAAGVTKRYVATLVNGENMFERREGWNITVCPFDLTFACYDPFGKSILYSSDAFFGQTLLDMDGSINVSGTFEAEGVLIFLFNAASSVTALTFTNTTRGESITVTHALAAGDVLQIDGEQKEVLLNGVAIDYDGVFPIFDVGDNSCNVTITGTSADWDLTLKHLSTYL